ncbi:hypothetical protein [Sphingobacterium siyangense]|uniref:MFS transporter n=1 Tax=Sphingobacterium siyangense TaxID=459529 RepID=A0A562MGX1_9SPHI|nr:hypothetical protein [Sphingobacterium siyangense]TWI19163.1 hypothetical protein IQ31_02909 [Sphingobacterium siyangense]
MEINPIFHPSVPKYIRYPAMFIIGTVVLSANGIFLGTAVDMYNGQGEYTEHFTMAYNAVFVGMALNILLAQRFAERYTNKTHMLVGLVGMLILVV